MATVRFGIVTRIPAYVRVELGADDDDESRNIFQTHGGPSDVSPSTVHTEKKVQKLDKYPVFKYFYFSRISRNLALVRVVNLPHSLGAERLHRRPV